MNLVPGLGNIQLLTNLISTINSFLLSYQDPVVDPHFLL